MRVLLVSRELAPFFGGGIGTYAAEMARVLAGAGEEVHVLTGPHEGLAARTGAVFPGVRVHGVDLDSGDAALEAYPAYPMRYAMAVYEEARRLHEASPFDYVEFPDYHGEGYVCVRAKRTLGAFDGAVLAVRLHSTSALCREADDEHRLDVETACVEHLEREAVAGADLVISPGRRVLERAAPPGPGNAGQTRRIIPVPLDADALVREFGGPWRRSSGGSEVGDAPPTVLFFGKLQHLKGPQDFVEAGQILLRRGVRARFRLIGNDSPTGPFGRSMLDHLRRRIEARHADAFEFEPARPRHELGGAIRGASVCCFPSRWEAFPMVCLEAMALGAPVVASKAGGLGEIIEDGRSGLLHPVGDAQALAERVQSLLDEPARRERLGEAAAARVRALCHPGAVVAQLRAAVAESTRTPPPRRRSAPERPLVSIIIPYYNLGAYLPETLASARAQTFADREILVIDDGSTEAESVALLGGLPADVRIVRKPNGGLGSARNAGLREARGRWVVPLDADDVIEPTLVEKAVGAAERDAGLSYVSPMVAYFTDDPARANGGWIPLGLEPDLLPVLNVGGAASGTLIDREAALAVGGWDESMPAYEDWEFWCRLAGAGKRGTVLPEFLLRYRVRADSMFRTELSRHLALHCYLLERHAGLVTNRAARLLASRAFTDPRAEARRLIDENVRYRLADRVNEALKKAGVQRALKGVAARVIRPD